MSDWGPWWRVPTCWLGMFLIMLLVFGLLGGPEVQEYHVYVPETYLEDGYVDAADGPCYMGPEWIHDGGRSLPGLTEDDVDEISRWAGSNVTIVLAYSSLDDENWYERSLREVKPWDGGLGRYGGDFGIGPEHYDHIYPWEDGGHFRFWILTSLLFPTVALAGLHLVSRRSEW